MAGVNPADRQIRAGLRFRLEKPFALTLGCEVSGIVVKRGAEVLALAVGDEVYGRLLRLRGYAEYAVESAGNLGRKPASLDHVHAAVWDALFEVRGLCDTRRTHGRSTGGRIAR